MFSRTTVCRFGRRLRTAARNLLSDNANLGNVATAQQLESRVLLSVPASPTGLGVTVGTGRQATLRWTDNSSNETAFRVYSRPQGGGSFTLLGTVAANVTSYTASTLSPETDYDFKVKAYDGTTNDESADPGDSSNSKSATTFGPLGWRVFNFTPGEDRAPWSGGTVKMVDPPDVNGADPGPLYYREGTSTLTLTDLPAHRGLHVDFKVLAYNKVYQQTVGVGGAGLNYKTDISNDWHEDQPVGGRMQSFPEQSGHYYPAYTNEINANIADNDQLDRIGTSVFNIGDSMYELWADNPAHTADNVSITFYGATGSDLSVGVTAVGIWIDLLDCGCEAAADPTGGYTDYTADLSSGGGDGYSHTTKLSDSGAMAVAGGINGNGVANTSLPTLSQITDTAFAVVSGRSGTTFISDGQANPTFRALEGATDILTLQDVDPENPGAGKEYVHTETTGRQTRFYDFSSTNPTKLRGRVKSFTDPAGNVTSINYYPNSDPAEWRNKVKEVTRSVTANGVTTTEVFAYSYYSSGANPGLLSNVKLQRGRSDVSSGALSTVRQVDYSYYGSSEANGNLNDLKLVEIKDGASPTPNVIDRRMYRYYKSGDTGGYAGALKLKVGADAYARLTAAGINPLLSTTTDATIKPYADLYLEYNSLHQVSKRVENGSYETTFTYASSENVTTRNAWRNKVTQTLPDGSKNIIYANGYGDTVLEVFQEAGTNGRQWCTYHRYDEDGHEVLTAHPSAVTGYDEAYPDLVGGDGGGHYFYISDDTGLVEKNVYYAANETPAGYLKEQWVQRGDNTAAIQTRALTYTSATANDGTIVYNVESEAVYSDEAHAVSQVTDYAYTYFSGTAEVQSVTTTHPLVTTDQNGPGARAVEVAFNDAWGREVWHKDAEGHIDYTAYDQATGAVVKTIVDVNTANISDFTEATLPSGWSGAGLHLITLRRVDGFGRETKLTDPQGNITYTVYNDAAHEQRVYRGWTGSAATGPTEVTRQYRPTGSGTGDWVYDEQLISSATPNVTGGEPAGTEDVNSASTIQSLSRQILNSHGQVQWADRYFSLSGQTYTRVVSTSSGVPLEFGSQNTNFYREETGYGVMNRVVRFVNALGTVRRTVYDSRGQAVSQWVGTDDVPTSGTWSPTNTGGTDLTKVQDNLYDQYPHTLAAPSAPSLSQTSGGSLPAATYYVKVAYVNANGETLASAESSLTVSANNRLVVSSPAASGGATGYHVYVSTTSGAELRQNGTTPLSIGTSWTMPTRGLVSNVVPYDRNDARMGPTGPTLDKVAGGTNAATTYYVRVSYVDSSGETLASSEASLAVPANQRLVVKSPASATGVTGYHVYVSTTSGAERRQNGSTPVSIGTDWTLTTALVTNTEVPVGAPPAAAPSLSQTSGGSLPATTYYVRVSYVDSSGETVASAESSLSVSANNVLVVASPAARTGATGYHVYVSTTSGRGWRQNGTSPLSIGTSWTMPTTGLVTVAVPPRDNVGDGNLTQVTQDPGSGQTNRITRMYYDWRDRMRASKAGVEASESTSTNRPIIYFDYDNLDQQTVQYLYDGDGVTLTTTAGVPNKPLGSLLRGKSEQVYDAGGRVYRTLQYGIRSDGSEASSLASDVWYDKRGNVIKTREPGGLVYKYRYDGAGRLSKEFASDGGSDTAWTHAGDVDNDMVLEQTEYAYDKAGNVIHTTKKERFHGITSTGELGDPGTAPLARVSYAASYYDAANRLTTSVDHGTNGGKAFSRAASAPGRTVITGTATGGTTTTLVDTGRSESTAAFDDYFVGYTIKITSGTGVGGTAVVTDYNYSTKTFTVSPAFPTAPGSGSGYSLTPNALVTTYAYKADEVQTVTITGSPTGGTFTLTFNGQTTSGIVYNATAGAVQSALQALSNIGSGNVAVIGAAGGPYTVRFINGLNDTNVSQLTASGTGLTGGTSPSVSVATQSHGGDNGRLQKVTDPRGIVTKSDYDFAGRRTRTIAAFTDAVPSASDDQMTQYTYDGADHVLTLTAVTTGTNVFQTTRYVYGVTTGGGSNLTSNDLLREVQYPDASSGSPGTAATNKNIYKYNALGEAKELTDQNETVHTYGYDTVGRLTNDAVAVKSGNPYKLNTAVLRLETAYDEAGRPYLFTSYDAVGGPAVVKNQVKREFNALGQLTSEWQDHDSVVDSSSLRIRYAYSEDYTNNHSRLTAVVYPDGRVLAYGYAAGLDAAISRVSHLSDTSAASANLEQYSYLGLATIVERIRPETGVRLTYVKQSGETDGEAGDQYAGLDRFGRVVDQRWRQTTGTPADVDRFKYGYDKDSNRLYKENTLSSANSELYHFDGSGSGYDALNRLTAFQRGTMTDTNSDGVPDTISSESRSQTWTLDALGNWTTSATNGVGTARTHDQTNQIASYGGVTWDNSTWSYYDANGNMRKDENGKGLVYDAWNRLVGYDDNADGDVIDTGDVPYAADALGRRITTDPVGATPATDLYYSSDWQVLDERVGGQAKYQYVWGLGYVDDLVLRDEFITGAGTADTSFDTDGKVTTDFGGDDFAAGVAIQPDGKIVAAGWKDGTFAVARYNRDGSLDTSFDTDGKATASVPGGGQGYAMALQPDGKMVVVGYCNANSVDFALVRFNADGSLDTSFDGDGVQTTDLAAGSNDAIKSVALDAQGRIVVAGWKGSDYAVARYTSSGALDTSFDGDGWLVTDFGSGDQGNGVMVQPDGKIVVAGITGNGTQLGLARYNDNGSLDASFSGDGLVTNSSVAFGYRLALAAGLNGKILVSGANGDFTVVQYNADGTIDTSFGGGDGIASVDLGMAVSDYAYSLFVQQDGRIVLAGASGSSGSYKWGVARFLPDGSLDTSFDSDGWLTTDFAGANSAPADVAVANDGRIVAVGGKGTTGSDFAITVFNGGKQRLYVQQDANFNVTSITDPTGAVQERYQYDPYGVARVYDGSWVARFTNNLSFTGSLHAWTYLHQGGRYDQMSKLYEFRNRGYSPTLGRWAQTDPKQFIDGMSRYEYVQSTPVDGLDPKGLEKYTAQHVGTIWESFWTFEGYEPVPLGSDTAIGKSKGKADTAFMRAMYHKRYRHVFLICDATDAGPGWKLGEIEVLKGSADAPQSAEFSAPVYKPFPKSPPLWTDPQSDLPNWLTRPKEPSAVDPLPPVKAPEGYKLRDILRCKCALPNPLAATWMTAPPSGLR